MEEIDKMVEEYEKVFHSGKDEIRVMSKDDYIFYALIKIIRILLWKK